MLKYIGKGNWLPGYPARDLSVADVARLGGEKNVLATGLYKKVAKPKAKSNKAASGPAENKKGG